MRAKEFQQSFSSYFQDRQIEMGKWHMYAGKKTWENGKKCVEIELLSNMSDVLGLGSLSLSFHIYVFLFTRYLNSEQTKQQQSRLHTR